MLLFSLSNFLFLDPSQTNREKSSAMKLGWVQCVASEVRSYSLGHGLQVQLGGDTV